MKLFLKQRNMYYMKYWCKHVNDADVAAELSRVYLQEDSDTPIEDLAMFFKEMDAANLLIKEYQLFIDELDDVEYKVLMSYVNDEPLDSMDKGSYESIKVKVFKKWCKKFMVDNLIYIHELDTPKLGKILKDKRIEKYYSVNSVTDFLGISADVLRNYETGRRTPRINVLYALCELYELDIVKVIKASLK